MLLGAGGVVQWYICYLTIPAQQLSILSVNVQDWQLFVTLEDIKSSLPLRFSGLWGLAVLDNGAVHCVGVGQEGTREFSSFSPPESSCS